MSRNHIAIVALLALVAVGLGAGFYPYLPDPCPTHWNIHGKVDGYGPRWVAAFLAPMFVIPIMGLMIVLPLLGPFRRNFDQFRVTYGRIAIVIALMMAALQLIILLASIGVEVQMGRSICGVLGLLFAVIGNWMGKVRRNFYVGIRTPWTLANETVWERTHRLGGRLFVAAGLISALTAVFFSDIVCFVVLMTTLIGTSVWSVVYSYLVYRKLGSVDDFASAH